jgi:hypothetical protein
MKWFRFYSETLEDPKVQRLPIALRWRWVEILCLANRGNPRGRLPDLAGTAYALRMNTQRTQNVLDAFMQRTLLEQRADGLYPHNWEARQPSSDNVAERVKRHRVTLQKRSVDTDKETDTEKDTEEAAAAGEVFAIYEKAFGKPVPNGYVADQILQAEAECGRECLTHSLEEAARNEARSFKYVEQIMANHQANGCTGKVIEMPADLAWIHRRSEKAVERYYADA